MKLGFVQHKTTFKERIYAIKTHQRYNFSSRLERTNADFESLLRNEPQNPKSCRQHLATIPLEYQTNINYSVNCKQY